MLITPLLYAVFHPSWKLDYFKEAGWEAGWIRKVKGSLRLEYENRYAGYEVPEEDGAATPEQEGAGDTDAAGSSHKVCHSIPYTIAILFNGHSRHATNSTTCHSSSAVRLRFRHPRTSSIVISGPPLC